MIALSSRIAFTQIKFLTEGEVLAPIKRSYDAFIENLRKSLAQNENCMRSIGSIQANGREYNLVKIILGKGNPKKVLISAGIHGDEYAGTRAILAMLDNNFFKEFDADWEVTLLPCINPTGYEQNTRENHAGNDLNRLFKSKTPPGEVTLIKKLLDSHFDLTLELHEDLDSPGLYVYMKGLPMTDKGLGRKVIEAMKIFMPVNMDSEIEEVSAENGLLANLPNPDQMDWWPMAMYAINSGSRTSFTIETSTNFPIERRVSCHLAAIQTAMRNFTNFK